MIEKNDLIGKEIGNYRVIDKIASGSFGSVYRAQHISLQERIVAIKLLHASLSSSKEREDFLQEARILYKLENPYILRLLDCSTLDNAFPYLITDYAPNGTLKDRIQNLQPNLLPLEKTLPILSQIGQALHYAHHQGVIHRDLKPANILFKDQDQALLADFGIAITASAASVKRGEAAGTPLYMAPENFHGQYSEKSDQYALGCIAYELVTGRTPFLALNIIALGYMHEKEQPVAPRQLNNKIPLYIEQAILKAMSKEPTDRYPNIIAFLIALGAYTPKVTSSNIFQGDMSTVLATQTSTTGGLNAHNGQPKVIEKLLEEGNTHFSAQHYEEALSIYEQIMQLDPKSAQVYYNKGKTLERLERYMEAFAAYDQAIYLDANFASAYNGRGDIYIIFESYEDALKAYSEATRVAPKDALGYYNKAVTFERLGRSSEALSAYKSAILFEANPTYIYIRQGDLFEHLERYNEAIATHEIIIKHAPDFFETYHKKIALFERLKRHDEAIATYETLIQRAPNNFETYHKKIALLERLKRHDEAIATYERLIQRAPKDLEIYYQKIALLERLKRYNEAIATYERIIKRAPNHLEAYHKKIALFERIKQFDEALATYEQLIKRAPNNFEIYYQKIALLKRLKRYDEALATYEQLIKRAPDNFEAYHQKIALLEHLKRHDEAIATYERVIQQAPSDQDAYYKKGELLESTERYAEAIATYERIIQFDPSAHRAYYGKGRSLEMIAENDKSYRGFLEYIYTSNTFSTLKEFTASLTLNPDYLEVFITRLKLNPCYKEAFIAYEQAILFAPNLLSYRTRKGDTLTQLGKFKQAYEAYKRADELASANREFFSKIHNVPKGIDREDITLAVKKVENAKNIILIAASNPMLIPIILAAQLHSWLIFIGIIICGIVSMIFFLKTLLKTPYYLYDGIKWFLPIILFGFGWASIVWLLIPSSLLVLQILCAILGFLISFLGNGFLYLSLDIFFIDDQRLSFINDQILSVIDDKLSPFKARVSKLVNRGRAPLTDGQT